MSYGILCIRYKIDHPEILMVKKRCTHSYCAFVHGNYINASDDAELLELFNHMTIEEKRPILTFNYELMWYQIWTSCEHKSFESRKKKFEDNFKDQDRIKKLIESSESSEKMWEIPKGHKASNAEKGIDCAMREFKEETGIQKSQYNIINFPIFESHSYNNVRYTQILYIAIISDPEILPKLDLRSTIQLNEISDVGWKPLNFIKKQNNRNSEIVYSLCMKAVKICKSIKRR